MQRLKAFLQSERGNVLAMGAAAMPMLLASAGFAVDTIQLSVMKRQMQRAADSSAIAGAYALTQAQDASQEQTYATDAATRDIAKNKTPTLVGTPTIFTGASEGFPRTVRVTLEAKPRLPFMAIFTKSGTSVTATATAALVEGGTFCVLSLFDGSNAPGIEATGNATLNLGCGLASNARGTAAISAGGSSVVTASPIMAAGGLAGSSNYAGDTKLLPYGAEQKDPFASLNLPSYDTSNCPAIEVKNNEILTLPLPNSPAVPCYSSIDVKGTLTVSGPIVVHGGNITFGSGAVVTGTDVTFFLTGTNGAAGTFDTDGHPTLNLTAPTSGTYKNVLVYRDRRAAVNSIKINGDAQSILTGALYFPTSNVEINGNAGFRARCFQLVGLQLKFSGNSNIVNTCTNPGGSPTFRLEFVRLVK